MSSNRCIQVLRDLAASMVQARSAGEVLVVAAQVLAAYRVELPFVLFYLIDSLRSEMRLVSSMGLKPGTAASPELLSLGEEIPVAWPLAEVARTGRAVPVKGPAKRYGPYFCGPYREAPSLATLLPVLLPGCPEPAAILVVGASAYPEFNGHSFYDHLTAEVASALAAVQAFDADGPVYTLLEEDKPCLLSVGGKTENSITEHKEAIKGKPEAGKQPLHLVLSQLPAIIWATDNNLCVTFSAGEYNGPGVFEFQERTEKTLLETMEADDPEQFYKAHRAALSGNSSSFEFRYGERIFQASVKPLKDSGGAVTGVAGAAQEITGRGQSEEHYRLLLEELQVADRRKDELLGVLSHEMRNPLASIMLSSAMLDRAAPGGEQARRAKEIMDRQIARISRLVDDLLDFTRMIRNKIVLEKKQLELNDLVARTVKDYQPLFLERGICLETRFSASELYTEADPARLSQVVGCLLDNAAKFSENGGSARIIISKDELQSMAVISIENSGAGLATEIMSDFFQPFVQADNSLAHSSGGLGLGLALVKGLVELHGGEASAYSEGPGKGSTFTVSLPLAGEAAPSGSEFTQAGQYRGRKVLVIEDLKDVADSLKILLEDEGHEVMVAENGLEGIARAREFKPEVLLCDIGLPGIDGYEVAQAFCADEKLKNVFLVSLTGNMRPEDLQRGKEAGFQCQLAKPVDPAILRKTLARAI